MKRMQRTTIFLTNPQVKKLKAKAKELGLSMSELIRRILDEWLAKNT